MSIGPKLNNISRNFTSRDSLGIDGVSTTMSAELCPVINTVTPRAFYWPFMVWIYYDFYKYSGIETHTVKIFDQYLKRQDYFFVLANLLTEDSDRDNMVGKQKTQEDINKDQNGPYPFNPNYFKTRYGGMQYYNAGCLSMNLIIDHNPKNPDEVYPFPKLTESGEEMALTFEQVIKNTVYYKEYRRNALAVPRDVLEEYGKVINIRLKGFDECKILLRKKLFNKNLRLTNSANYAKYLFNNYAVSDLTTSTFRRAFFDHQDDCGATINIPLEHLRVAQGWELVVARQYFTIGLEMIWKLMLALLSPTAPQSKKQWIENIFAYSQFQIDLDKSLAALIPDCNLDFNRREEMIQTVRLSKNDVKSVENGLILILSIYNRINDRHDLMNEAYFYDYGNDGGNISFSEFIKVVNDHKNRPLKDFLVFVMDHWLITQHYVTSYEKMLQERDGFFFEIIDGQYIKKKDFTLHFQGIRFIQLLQVMQDLDMV